MNLEKLKKNNKIVQENQIVPSVIKMDYFLINPEIFQDLYIRNLEIKENISQTNKIFQDLQEKLIQDNIKMKKKMKDYIEQSLEENF